VQDFDPLAFQKLGQPDLRLQREVGFIRALPLDLGGVDVEDPDGLRLPRRAQPDGIPVPDTDFGGFAGCRAEQDGNDDMAEHGEWLSS